MRSESFRTEFALYLMTFFSALFLVFSLMIWVPGFDLHLPRMYEGDALFSSMMVKSIIDNGSVFINPYLGAPGVLNMGDFPQVDMANFELLRLFSLFGHDYPVVINLYFFSTFLLNAVFCLFAMRQLGLTRLFSFAGSLLFAFLPYHFFRNEAHLFLNATYVIPIYTLFILYVWGRDALSFVRNKYFKGAIALLALIFAASSGVYYAFFASFLLAVMGIFGSLNQHRWLPLIKSGVIVALISITVLGNMIPTFKERMQEGANAQVAHRDPREAEIAALKITQMVFPVDNHRVGFLRKFRKHYNASAPLVTENTSATLGIVGVVGLLFLFSILFLRMNWNKDETLILLSQLNIASILLSVIGGLGAVFSYLVMAEIRSYNRMSVFIAFFALCAFFLVIQKYGVSWMKKKIRYVLFTFFILAIGLADQIPIAFNPNYTAMRTSFENDARFVAKIEKQLPPQSRIFQLPVQGFPEYPTIVKMFDYEQFRGYLHSHQLRWSMGAMMGRNTLSWQQSVSKKALPVMLKELVDAGFVGIYINRLGYKDYAVQLEQQLKTTLNQTPLESADKQLLFFNLLAYKK